MKIYTKTGDLGETSLIGGSRVPKGHARLEAYGTLDELNSQLGLVRALLQDEKSNLTNSQLSDQLDEFFSRTQHQLFNLGSHLACEDPNILPKLPPLEASEIDRLESWMDEWQAQLPTLKNFILPGGSKTAACLHVVRTLARRAEREVSRLSQMTSVDATALVYLNRLSDACFVAARMINQGLGHPDVIWKKSD